MLSSGPMGLVEVHVSWPGHPWLPNKNVMPLEMDQERKIEWNLILQLKSEKEVQNSTFRKEIVGKLE